MDTNSPPQTLAQASTAPNVSGALQSLLLSRAHSEPESEQIGQNRQSALQEYQNTLQEPVNGTFTPTEQGMYSWVENMGKMNPFAALTTGVAAGGKALLDQQTAQQANRVKAAQVGYSDAQDLDRMDERELAALRLGRGMGANGGQGKYIQFKDDKGNLYIMNNLTGEKQVIPASQSPLWATAFKIGLDKAVTTRNADPEAFATEFANRAIANSPAATAGAETTQNPQVTVPGKTPVTPDPMRVSPATQTSRDAEATQIKNGEADGTQKPWPTMPPEVKAPPPAKPGLSPVDTRGQARAGAYGDSEGKGLFKEREDMTALYGANDKLINQLNMLEHLYQNPDIPEGELGPQIQGLRSGLKSLGIDVSESTGLGDIARAISTNLALGMKNADGHNMLPGAMSNYEDQLLQKMSPTLSMTQQGRLGMIAFMKEVAAANMRLASEATKMARNNTVEKDALPPEWNARKERVMLEEMARLKDASKKIVAQYGVR